LNDPFELRSLEAIQEIDKQRSQAMNHCRYPAILSSVKDVAWLPLWLGN
jgi:hypothetical protein